jgi:leucyl aminopeptidase
LKFEVIDSIEKVLEGKNTKGFDRIFVFGVFQGDENNFLKNKNLKDFGFIYKRIKQLDFKAKKGKSIIVESPLYSLVWGLDKKDGFNYEALRNFISDSSIVARTNKIKEIIFIIPELPEEYHRKSALFYLSASAVEGAELGLYMFKKYLTNDKEKNSDKIGCPEKASVYFDGLKITKDLIKAAENGFDFGKKVSSAVNFARDIVNEPGNVVTPEYLAEIAKDMSSEKSIECEVFNEKEILKKGMNAFYGVGQGSKNPARFIHLVYKPAAKSKNNKNKKIAIVGKGITFDSGGLSLKPADFMTNMKSDKSGACAVLGIMKHIKDFDIDLEVHGIIAACENMPDGGAQRPDDIVKALNGKTIEIENTDAEGRLTLADALTFASNLGVDEIIDLATLTGACVVALGEYTSGVMGNDKSLIGNILAASRISGERMWELPFDDNMKEKLLSPVADLKNVGNRYGGAITAGMFLAEFVPDKIKWCHIDIAGPAFTKTGFTCNPKGATGAGVRTLLYYLSQHKI